MNTSIRIVDVNQVYSGNLIPEIAINAYSSLTITAYWRAINFIAENMARFPRSVRDPKAAADAAPHPLTRLLARRPNNYQNPFVFWRTFWFHVAHTANGYARVERGPGLAPIALHNLLPNDALPVRYTPEGGIMEQFYLVKSARLALHGSDVLHVSGLGWDGMAGTDPVSLHDSTFQRASTIDRYTTKFLQKGTIVRGSIEVPGHLDDTQLASMKGYIRQHFHGPDADEDVLVIPDGGKLNNTTLSPEQSKLIEQGKHSTRQISQITGVPPEFLFEFSDSKYVNNVEAAGQNAVRYCFGPLIEQAEAEFSMKLLTESEQDAGLKIRMNPDALLRGDTAAQVNTIATSVKSGLRTRNEGRALLDLPADADPKSNTLSISGDTTPQAAETPNKPSEENQE